MNTATKATLLSMHWDTDLSALRLDNEGRVMGLKCGLLLAEDQATMQPGQVYFRLISASFIDEVAAQGRHTVTVDVIDETGRRLDGATVHHGWPWNEWPGFDEVVSTTVYGATLAEWGVFAQYDPNRVEYGPYWVKVDGMSDVFFGFGLPWNRHVCFVAVFQRMVWGDVNPPDPGTGGEYRCTAGSVEGRYVDHSRQAGTGVPVIGR